MRRARVLAAGAGLAFALAGFAQPLAVREQGGAKFVSGGVGEEERAALAEMRGGFNVQVTSFVPKGGSYLSDVAVSVRDALEREVFATTTEGPFLFARLPAGAYKLTATFDGKTLTRRFTVREAGRTEIFLPFDDPTAHWEKGMEPERERKPAARR